jgi:hypothetical protein
MKNIKRAIRLIAVHLGLSTSVALGAGPDAGREGHPTTRSRLRRWTALLALAIALAPGAASAQETDTVKISGRFSMDYLYGELDLSLFEPDLLGVYYNGHEHTWTLTLHGTTHSHFTFSAFGVTRATQIHATSFDLEFFGPDAATLNGIVSKHLAGRSVNVYLENTYYANGGGFAIMHVGVGGGFTGQLYFYTGQDMGSLTLFPADADGYPVVRPEPFSIEPDITELSEFEMFSGTGFNMGSLAGPVTFEGSVGPVYTPPPPPPALSIGDASVVEGDRGSSKLQFTVSRSGSGEGTVSVNYRTVAGTALAKSDYTAASGTLTFPPGVWSQTITIAVTGDRKREPNETFTVELFNTFGGTVGDAVATGTILNDD